jgi:hypothetical protein
MRTQTKLITLLLTLPMAYAETLNGDIASTRNLDVAINADTNNHILTESGFESNPITLTIDDNEVSGWKVYATSGNGSRLFLAGVTSPHLIDGYNLYYDVSCDSDSTVGAESAGANNISLPTSGTTGILTSQDTAPSVVTDNLAINCQLAVDTTSEDNDSAAEAIAELFEGEYGDTISVTLTDL